jgi:hypothetical protein
VLAPAVHTSPHRLSAGTCIWMNRQKQWRVTSGEGQATGKAQRRISSGHHRFVVAPVGHTPPHGLSAGTCIEMNRASPDWLQFTITRAVHTPPLQLSAVLSEKMNQLADFKIARRKSQVSNRNSKIESRKSWGKDRAVRFVNLKSKIENPKWPNDPMAG